MKNVFWDLYKRKKQKYPEGKNVNTEPYHIFLLITSSTFLCSLMLFNICCGLGIQW